MLDILEMKKQTLLPNKAPLSQYLPCSLHTTPTFSQPPSPTHTSKPPANSRAKLFGTCNGSNHLNIDKLKYSFQKLINTKVKTSLSNLGMPLAELSDGSLVTAFLTDTTTYSIPLISPTQIADYATGNKKPPHPSFVNVRH